MMITDWLYMGIDAQMTLVIKENEKFLSEDDVLNLSYRLCCAFGHNCFLLSRKENRHALSIITEKENKQFISVELWDRYYSENYPRGPIEKLIAIAQWLEINMPQGQIYYGGDNIVDLEYNMLGELFNKKRRDELFKYFALKGHEEYYERDSVDKVWCDFCKNYLIQYGFGPNHRLYRCQGCGLKKETTDNGETWKETT